MSMTLCPNRSQLLTEYAAAASRFHRAASQLFEKTGAELRERLKDSIAARIECESKRTALRAHRTAGTCEFCRAG